MTVTLPAILVDSLPKLTGGAIKTYLALYMLKSVVKKHPTQEEIAAYMHASPRSVVRYLYELERGGYIMKRRIGAGRKTDYVLLTELDHGAR